MLSEDDIIFQCLASILRAASDKDEDLKAYRTYPPQGDIRLRLEHGFTQANFCILGHTNRYGSLLFHHSLTTDVCFSTANDSGSNYQFKGMTEARGILDYHECHQQNPDWKTLRIYN